MLKAARARTLLLTGDLRRDQFLGPQLAIVNPPLWEIGHIGWFQEYWCLRQKHGRDTVVSQIKNADTLYDSAAVPHRTRWNLPLPRIEATLDYLDQVLACVLERLDREGATATLTYFTQLAAFHEEMHCEALTYYSPDAGLRTAKTAGRCRRLSRGRESVRMTWNCVVERSNWARQAPTVSCSITKSGGTRCIFCRSEWRA